MKRVIIFLLCSLPIVARAQVVTSVGVTANLSEQKVVTETTAIYENATAYAYNEINPQGYWYGQYFVERKWWQQPIYLHAEYRGTIFSSEHQQTALLGLAWCYYGKNGYCAVEPLAAWKEYLGFGAQLSFVGGWNWNRVELQHYTDILKTAKMNYALDIYNELRAYYRVYKGLSLGAIGTMYCATSEVLSAGLYVAAKYTF